MALFTPTGAPRHTDGALTLAGDLWAQHLIVTNGTGYGPRNLFTRSCLVNDTTLVTPGTYISASTGEERPATIRFDVDTAQMLDMYVLTNEGVPQRVHPATRGSIHLRANLDR